jgi:hypothetical protein
MHVTGRNRQDSALIVADHETAILVDRLESPTHDTTVDPDGNLPAESRRPAKPTLANGGKPVPVVP